AREGEGEVEVTVGEVVEEDAADAARLTAMLQVEILVAPALELRVVLRAGLFRRRRERRLASGVEMARVFLEAVIRREVHAAVEQPAFLDDAARPAAAFRTGPGVFSESAVEIFQRGDDALLQAGKIFVDRASAVLAGGGTHGQLRFKAWWPMSLRYCMPAKRM